MPGVIISIEEPKEIEHKDFRQFGDNENELEKILVENPTLLVNTLDNPVKVIKNQLMLSKKKKIDILLSDSTGLPIIVEVKLKDNQESEREVVGQIFDYASSLNLMDYNDLLEKTGENLIETLKEFTNDKAKLTQLKNKFETRLKDGHYRLIIVVDSAPNDLIKNWLYVNTHSSLDIRLIAIQRYEIDSGVFFISPYHLVSNDFYSKFSTNASHPLLFEIANDFDRLQLAGIERKKTIEHDTIKIFINKWPKKVHYEFTYWNEEKYIAAEIVAELESFKQIAGDILLFQDHLNNLYPNQVIPKNNGNYKGWVRLQIKFSPESDSSEIVNAMRTLIDLTQKKLDEKIMLLNEGHY